MSDLSSGARNRGGDSSYYSSNVIRTLCLWRFNLRLRCLPSHLTSVRVSSIDCHGSGLKSQAKRRMFVMALLLAIQVPLALKVCLHGAKNSKSMSKDHAKYLPSDVTRTILSNASTGHCLTLQSFRLQILVHPRLWRRSFVPLEAQVSKLDSISGVVMGDTSPIALSKCSRLTF